MHGPPEAEAGFVNSPRRLERWLREQAARYETLHPAQHRLLAEAGLTAEVVAALFTRPDRHAPFAVGLACAASYATGTSPSASPPPTRGSRWGTGQRTRQRRVGHTTPGGLQLAEIDPWWNPPWPVSWQRAYTCARGHQHGLPEGAVWWPQAMDTGQARRWVQRQRAAWETLQPDQQQLLAALKASRQPSGPGEGDSPQISDAAWSVIAPLLPRRGPMTRPPPNPGRHRVHIHIHIHIPHRRPLERPSRTVRPLADRLPALRPMDRQRHPRPPPRSSTPPPRNHLDHRARTGPDTQAQAAGATTTSNRRTLVASHRRLATALGC